MDKYIGLGIIFFVLIAGIMSIYWLVKFIIYLNADYLKYRKDPKPWLRHKGWVEKKIVWKGPIRGSFVIIFFAIFILPFLVALIINITSFNEKNLLEIIPFLIVLGPVLGYFVYAWLRQRKFCRSICYIETLPGVIGGYFRGKVEMYFPNEHPKDFKLILKLVSYDHHRQKFPDIWEKEKIIRQEEVEYQGNKKHMVPIHIDIPIDVPLKKLRNSFFLILKSSSPGIDYLSQFHIPVFDTKKYGPVRRI